METILRPDPYTQTVQGVFCPPSTVHHVNDHFEPGHFALLYRMQQGHFWYLGRQRFIGHAVKNFVAPLCAQRKSQLRTIDLGGGCGGFANFLSKNHSEYFSEIATSDSSLDALHLAREWVEPRISRYQVDLLHLEWERRWEVAFLLDVLEHLDDDVRALRETARAVTHGGLIFVSMPALNFFHSHNDIMAHHRRRYTKASVRLLAERAGLNVLDVRYFNFFLSPLVYLARMRPPKIDFNDPSAVQKYMDDSHRTPIKPVNEMLKAIFNAETPVGHLLPFPWGTSVLGVLQVSE